MGLRAAERMAIQCNHTFSPGAWIPFPSVAGTTLERLFGTKSIEKENHRAEHQTYRHFACCGTALILQC